MSDLRAAAQQALEALEGCVKALDALHAPGDSIYTRASDLADRAEIALRAALAQQEKTCNCRWVGDVQTQQCTLHEAHVAAIHEWAERAKTAEAALAQQLRPGFDQVDEGDYDLGLDGRPNSQRA